MAFIVLFLYKPDCRVKRWLNKCIHLDDRDDYDALINRLSEFGRQRHRCPRRRDPDKLVVDDCVVCYGNVRGVVGFEDSDTPPLEE